MSWDLRFVVVCTSDDLIHRTRVLLDLQVRSDLNFHINIILVHVIVSSFWGRDFHSLYIYWLLAIRTSPHSVYTKKIKHETCLISDLKLDVTNIRLIAVTKLGYAYLFIRQVSTHLCFYCLYPSVASDPCCPSNLVPSLSVFCSFRCRTNLMRRDKYK